MNPPDLVAPFKSAPLTAFPDESAVVAPLASFIPHRPSRFACAPVISVSLAAAIADALRAVSQMRTSSMDPAKKPAAAPVVVRALPTVVSALVRAFAGWPTVRLPSGVPSR